LFGALILPFERPFCKKGELLQERQPEPLHIIKSMLLIEVS